MKMLLALLLLGAPTLAGRQSSQGNEDKPAIIQDGKAAKSYIGRALYEYLERPPYLAIRSETPFFAKEIAGKNVWLSFVEFYCGLNEQYKMGFETVIIYDPETNQHRFMNPDDLAGLAGGVAI
jgi:hypothetical protein